MTPLVTRLALALAVAAGVFAAERAGFFQAWELGAYDRWVAGHARQSESLLTLVRITEAEIARHGHPLEDALLADALVRITAAGPRAVGVDLYRDRVVGSGHTGLASLARDDSRVVWVHKLADVSGPAVAAPGFAEPAQHGFADVPLDEDGVARRALLYLWDDHDAPHVSFALQLATRFLRPEGIAIAAAESNPDHVKLGAAVLRPFESRDGGYAQTDAGGYQVLLDFRSGHDGFVRYTLTDLLDGRVPARAIEDRVVILGTAAPSVKDLLSTPLGVSGADPHLPGMEFHAHAVDQLVRNARGHSQPIRVIPHGLESAHMALWVLAGVFLGSQVRRSSALVATTLGIPIAILVAATLAYSAGWWIPVAAPAAGFLSATGLAVAWALSRERAEKHQLATLFGRHVSPAVFDAIWEQRSAFMDGGRLRPQRITATVLMADLAGFGQAADKLAPDQLMDWLGTCMAVLADSVDRHGGIVEDYAGDGMKANFGVPVARQTPGEIAADARAAVRCALATERQLDRLNEELNGRGLPSARVRIGIETGPVVVGSVGGSDHLKYTTVGDPVITAARLESLDRDAFADDPEATPVRILLAEGCARRVGDSFSLQLVGRPVLKGQSEATAVHRVLRTGAPGDAS